MDSPRMRDISQERGSPPQRQLGGRNVRDCMFGDWTQTVFAKLPEKDQDAVIEFALSLLLTVEGQPRTPSLALRQHLEGVLQ